MSDFFRLKTYKTWDWATLLNTLSDKGFPTTKLWNSFLPKDTDLYSFKDQMYGNIPWSRDEKVKWFYILDSMNSKIRYDYPEQPKVRTLVDDASDVLYLLLERNQLKEVYLSLKNSHLLHKFHIPKPVLEEAERRWGR